MRRILQLTDSLPEAEAQASADLLREQFPPVDRIELRDAAHLVSVLLNLRRTRRRYDLIHAFSERAFAAAVMVGGKIIYSPTRFPAQQQMRWVRAAMGYRDIQLICPTQTMHRRYVECGIPVERCHLIRPGVQFGKVNRRRNNDLRSRLGFSTDDHVILACGESTHAANHQLTLWAASILHMMNAKYKLLLWGRGEGIGKVRTFNRRCLRPEQSASAEQALGARVEFEQLLPAADSMLVTASGPVSTLPIAIGMAAALPIVSTVTPTVCELLEDRHNALLTPSTKPRVIAQKLLESLEDRSLQWRISDMARTEAYEHFPQTRCISQYRALYDQVSAGAPVKIPQPQPGAGSRFHGRG